MVHDQPVVLVDTKGRAAAKERVQRIQCGLRPASERLKEQG
jgi:hypothetical protein